MLCAVVDSSEYSPEKDRLANKARFDVTRLLGILWPFEENYIINLVFKFETGLNLYSECPISKKKKRLLCKLKAQQLTSHL